MSESLKLTEKIKRFNVVKRVHLICRLQSSANVCWGKKIQKPGPDSVRKTAVSDWLSIIDVCHKQKERGAASMIKICYP